jgi:hypothetical protein
VTSRRSGAHKKARRTGHGRDHDRRSHRLISVRSALVVELAVLAAVGGAGLLQAMHRSPAQLAIGGLGILAAALKLFDSLIDK